MRLSTNKLNATIATAMSLSIIALVLFCQSNSLASVGVTGDGAETFKAKCASCHGADGSGSTPVGKAMKLRDLGSSDVQSQTDDQLLSIISGGKNKMPGFEKSLGADKCKELVAFIRTLKK